jgi:aryl-alcohol dehydrogenase-like predicted oxidoreductase
MSGGISTYEQALKSGRVRAIAMQVFSGGATSAEKALEYVCSLPNVESILFGASSKENIHQTVTLINHYDKKYHYKTA